MCAPRPLNCGRSSEVKQLAAIVGEQSEEAIDKREYGLPSSHTTMSLSYYLTLSGLLYLCGFLSPPGTAVAVFLSLLWGAWIGLCRMYAAMHSLTDVIAGAVLCTVTVPVFLLCAPAVLAWIKEASLLSVSAAALGSMLVYPKPLKDTPSFLFAVSFLGAAAGAILGVRLRNGAVEQPPLDVRKWEHVHLTALQVLAGALLCVLSKEAATWMARPVMGVLLGAAPLSIRRLCQPPVHGHQSFAKKEDEDGHGDGVVSTVCVPLVVAFGARMPGSFSCACAHRVCCMQDGNTEPTASSELADAPFKLPCNARGEALDVMVYSRLCSYAALGFCTTCGCPLMFHFLGIERT